MMLDPRGLGAAERAVLAALIISALLLLLPFALPRRPQQAPRGLAWSPGYWRVAPRIGLTRVVPIAGSRLVNPATGAGSSEARGKASLGLGQWH